MAEYKFEELKPLREKNQEQYEPDNEEIEEYAQFIGISLPEEEYMLSIAREGITAQLPSDWQACQAPDGQLVYRNIKTMVVQQEHPLDEVYRQKVLQFRNHIDNYVGQNEPSLRTITEQRSQQRSIDLGEDMEVPSRQFFQQNSALRPQASSDLNRAVIYSSQQFSEPSISSNLIFIAQDSSKKKPQQFASLLPGPPNPDHTPYSLQLELQALLREQRLAQQLLEQLQLSNNEQIKKLKRKLRKRKRGQE